MSRTTAEERFWAKVEFTGFCWLWTGSTIRTGYGRFSPGRGEHVMVHRFAYALLVGPIPDDLVIDHLCRVRNCVNPDHLEPVTIAENNRRSFSPIAIAMRATHCVRGHLLPEVNAPGLRRRCKECERLRQQAPRPRRPRPPQYRLIGQRLPVTRVAGDGDTCGRGHAWTPENTYLPPKGRRECRECRRLLRSLRERQILAAASP